MSYFDYIFPSAQTLATNKDRVEGTNVTTGPSDCNKGPKCNNTWT